MDIEKLISDHRSEFDAREPDDKHIKHFREKLENRKMESKFAWQSLLKIAAIIVAVVASTVFLYYYLEYKPKNTAKQGITLSEISPEYEEVETYLQSNVNKKLQEFKNLKCQKSDINKEEILNELNEIDTTYNQLQKELLRRGKDERIINAMINCYQMKAEVLEQIINKVNDNC